MSYKGNFAAADVVNFTFNTASNGVPITLAGTPSLAVYRANNTTQFTTGVTLVVDFDSVTGLHHVSIDTNSGSYPTANDYTVVIAAGTVDSLSVVGTIVGVFSIGNRTAASGGSGSGRKVIRRPLSLRNLA